MTRFRIALLLATLALSPAIACAAPLYDKITLDELLKERQMVKELLPS